MEREQDKMKFELNEWKKEITDEEILSNIQETAKAVGKEYISISTYKSHGKYSQTAIQSHFGTWKKALYYRWNTSKINAFMSMMKNL